MQIQCRMTPLNNQIGPMWGAVPTLGNNGLKHPKVYKFTLTSVKIILALLLFNLRNSEQFFDFQGCKNKTVLKIITTRNCAPLKRQSFS